MVAIDESLDRQPDVFFGETAHLEQTGLELFEFFLEVADDALDRFHD
jgi:hypothetical protein